MRTAPCNSSEFSLFRIFFNLLHYRQMELCIPQFFEEVGLFVISRSTVQIRVLSPEKSRGYIKRCNPFLVTVRTAFLRLGNFAPTNAARDLGQFGVRFGTLFFAFSSCWYSICKAPEIFLRGFLSCFGFWIRLHLQPQAFAP